MMKHTAAAVLMLASGGALAEDDNSILFNDVGARYISSDLGGASGDGYGVNLNFALASYLHATFDYSTRTLDEADADADLEFFSGGIGANYALNEAKSIQVHGAITWEQLDTDFNAGGADPEGGDGGDDGAGGLGALCDTPLSALGGLLGVCDAPAGVASKAGSPAANGRTDGFGASLGIRALVMNNLELNATYKYRDYDTADESLIGVGAGYSFGNWVATLRYETYDKLDLDEWSLGVAYTFGNPSEDSGSIW